MFQHQLPGYKGPGVFYPRDSERSGGEEFLIQSQEGRDVSRHVSMSSRIPIQQLDDVVYAPTYTLPKRNPDTVTNQTMCESRGAPGSDVINI